MDATRASLELLYTISRELTSALDLRTVLTRVLFLSTSNTQAERGSMIVLDERQRPVDAAIVYEGRLVTHTVEQLKATLEQGLAGWVMRHREAALVPDTSQDARWLRRPDDSEEQTGSKSAICVPVLVREELAGVLTLVHAMPGFFGREHLALLQAIADQAGIAVHNARLYQNLQATQRRYQELFEDSIDPILITDMDGVIQEANRQAAQISGLPASELLHASILSLYASLDVWLGENMPAIHAGETVSCESELSPRSGPPIPVKIYARKIRFGSADHLQWILRDITERKQLDLLRDDLTAMIYHDLRSPLANIVSSLDMLNALLQDTNASDPKAITGQILNIAVRSSERMQRLINSLLDINQLEAGQPIANRKTVDVLTLVLEAQDAVQPNTSTKQQTLTLEVEDNLPGIWVDEDMIRRVLINLLENATKFTSSGGNLAVGAKREDGWVRFWIRDSGPGISSEAQKVIFNKFSRVQAERLSADRLPRGLGLGLAFCKLAVEAHGGMIGVESEPGKGSCFFFTAPAASAAATSQHCPAKENG